MQILFLMSEPDEEREEWAEAERQDRHFRKTASVMG